MGVLLRYLFALCGFLSVLLPCEGSAEVPIPPLTDRVIDLTGVLGPSRSELSAKLNQVKAAKGSELAVLIVPSTQPEEIEQFAIRVAEQWKLGRPGVDDGALLVVALADHRVRFEVGRGLEGDIPDVTANRIIRELIIPRFAENDMVGGITAGVNAMAAAVTGAELPAPTQRKKDSTPILALIVVLFLIGNVLALIFGSVFGAVGTGVLGFGGALFVTSVATSLGVGVLLWFLVLFREPLLYLLMNSGGASSYGGGGRGGGGSLGSGGIFSGGGASGRW